MECKITSIGWLAFLVCLVQHGSLVQAQNCSFYMNGPCVSGLNCDLCGPPALIDESCYEEFATSCDGCLSPSCLSLECQYACESFDDCCLVYANRFSKNDGCGGTYTDTTGMLLSPNYPGAYPSLASCVYIIYQPVGTRILLSIDVFDVGSYGANCEDDRLEVREGGTARSPLIGKYCGSNLPPIAPDTILSTGNQLYIWFFSDVFDDDGELGFKITYTLQGCSFGMVASPLYCPGNYAKKIKSVTAPVECTRLCEDHPQCQSVIYVPKGGDDRCLLNTCHEDELRAKSDSPRIRCLVKRGAQMWQPQC